MSETNTNTEQAPEPTSTPQPEVQAAPHPPTPAPAKPPETPAAAEPDIANDPRVREMLAKQAAENARAREAAIAEAKAAAFAEAEAKARQEAELAQLSELERKQHELETLKAAAAEREAREASARELLAATQRQIEFVRALNDVGASIARRSDGSTDTDVESIALKRLAPLVEGGMPMAEAIKSLQASDPSLFFKPAEPPRPTGTAPSTAAPRGSTPTPTLTPQGVDDVSKMTPTEYAAYLREVLAGKHTFDARTSQVH